MRNLLVSFGICVTRFFLVAAIKREDGTPVPCRFVFLFVYYAVRKTPAARSVGLWLSGGPEGVGKSPGT